ncbi:uncharacterized protein N7498_003415 [Penicillium cinerascens]|uniref:Uncharacterized protein n=1 Tax=Penicillium cinerascens TaxID=70096 RepID=A0A9W9N206_9EURO|nr:uncharacterized protein N7498_003415 [Penicillium cinerascens]KAJ5211769.1 hypothetical protein N7498_003415 [Penicillium cinerascens]
MPSPTRPSQRLQSPSAQNPERPHHRSSHGHSHSHRHRHRDTSRSRSRSRSPRRSDGHKSDRRHRREDRGKERERDRVRRERREKEAPAKPVILPFRARELSRRDLETYEPMFAMYLDIQKGRYIEDMKEDEVKGRWKSFIQKWNRGELAEGWYEPATLQKARQNAVQQPALDRERASPDYARGEQAQSGDAEDLLADNDDDDEDYGPKLPHPGSMRAAARSGPAIPNMQDLELQREPAIEDAIASRDDSRQQYRSDMRSHKAEQRHLEDEVAPRAEAGTRERQLEKRREAAAANRSFAEARGPSPEAAPEEELMGSGDNDLAALKREKEKDQRKKNEREIRREEILRARAAEREERIQKYREKEEETIGWLQTLAKQRFG